MGSVLILCHFQRHMPHQMIFLLSVSSNVMLTVGNNRVRGGLATFIKKEILSGVKLIDKTIDDMMWFKLSKSFFWIL